MKATLLRERLTKIISLYGDVDLFIDNHIGTYDIEKIVVPSARNFEKEDKGYIECR